ncbi:hypothetical protein JL722_14705 [Aureococcus anophagefferens]|nr:hypothetical protein JL722_14705 [Aureococcus anophagefferens]
MEKKRLPTNMMMVMMWVGALLAALTAAAAPYDSTEFVALNHSRPALWVFEDTGVEMLFVAEPARTALDCGVDAAVDAFGEAAPSVAPGLSIAGYVRPDTVSRFCGPAGAARRLAVAARLHVRRGRGRAALRELADWIDESPTRPVRAPGPRRASTRLDGAALSDAASALDWLFP